MNRRALVIGILVLLLFSSMGMEGTGVRSSVMEKKSSDFGQVIEANGVRYLIHDVIRINSNVDFSNQAAAEGWAGNGTQSNPYIISYYDIDAHGEGDAVYIGNTTVYFIIKHCYIHNASNKYLFYLRGAGIMLYNVENGAMKYNIITKNKGEGVYMYSSNKNSVVYNSITNNNEYGVYLGTSDNNIISNNNVTANGGYDPDGIYLTQSHYNWLINNSISNNKGSGIYDHGGSNLIKNNYIFDNDVNGISLNGISNDTITSNKITNNTKLGIKVASSKDNKIAGNSMENNGIFLTGDKVTFTTQNITRNNTVNGKPVYYYKNINTNNASVPSDAGEVILGNVSWLTINGLNLSFGDVGIEIAYSSNVSISNNTITYNNLYGNYIVHTTNTAIINDSISNNGGDGIYLGSSSDNTIVDAVITYNHGYGIYLEGSSSNNIINSDAYRNSHANIYLHNSVNNNITHNTINGYTRGIYILSSDNNQINNNNIQNSYYYHPGIEVESSSGVSVTNNTIENNKNDGIYLYKANNNLLLNNNLTANEGNGIHLYLANWNKILQNDIRSSGKIGIYLYTSNNNTMMENNITNNSGALLISSSNNSNIINNNICKNGFGIKVASSKDNKIAGNSMENNGIFLTGDKVTFTTQNITINNTVNGKPVYYYKNTNMNNASVPSDAGEVILGNVSWLTINGLNLSFGDVGIEIAYSSNVSISNNTITYNNLYGNYIVHTTNTAIINDSISNNGGDGIYLGSSSDNTIVDAVITYNHGYGIYLKSSEYNKVYHNTIKINAKDGIYMYYDSDNNNISQNNINDNSNCGIHIDLSLHNYLIQNNISYNKGYGISIRDSSRGNNIFRNNITNNSGDGLILSSGYNTITNNYISNNKGNGIYEYKCNDLIKNNTITGNNENGVYIDDAEYNKILYNKISNNIKNGVSVYNTLYMEIIDNNIQSNGENGIYFWEASRSTITDNKIANNSGAGIYLDVISEYNKIIGNSMLNDSIFLFGGYGTRDIFTTQNITINNTVNGKPVYYYKNTNMNNASVPSDAGEVILGDVSWLTINGLNVSFGDVGIEIGYSSYVSVINNDIEHESLYGLYISYSSQNNITNNNFTYGGTGIMLEYSGTNNVSRNNIVNNLKHGLYLSNSKHNNMIRNNISANNGSGIYLDFSSNSNYICENYIEKDNNGISISSSDSNIIKTNRIYNNSRYGIYISAASNNNIVENLLINNSNYAVYITYASSDNYIYNNSFCYNHGSGDRYSPLHIQAYDRMSNHWNSDGYGNYWYDWANNNNTNDQNHDGIVDWPYKIDGGGKKDYYPLKYTNCTLISLPPTAPQDLQASFSTDYVNLTWNIPLGNGSSPLTAYRIYRNGTLLATVPATQLWYNDSNVKEGFTYLYYVTAVNSVGESDKSNEVQVIPGRVPSAPQNLVANAGNGYVNLTWNASTDNGSTDITEYRIYRNGELLATVPANQLYFNDTNVVNGQTYTYYVTAVNTIGESSKSNEVQATPGGAVPELQAFWLPIIALLLLLGILRKRDKKRN